MTEVERWIDNFNQLSDSFKFFEASEGQRKLLRIALNKQLGDARRKEFLYGLCGKASLKKEGGCSDAQVIALLELVDLDKNYVPCEEFLRLVGSLHAWALLNNKQIAIYDF